MVNDYEGEEDDICGWGAADFDDEFTERKETVTKGSKRNLQRKLVHYNQKLQQSRGMEPLPPQGSNLDLENHNGAPVYRKIKRKQPKEKREPQNYHNITTTSHRRERFQSKMRMLLLLLLDASDE
ncbi:hypothetical protein PPTG_20367 [Phytophthora nicotianae INRA-310]|uniref:Uncharacterized protein n=1 Tax=Phytophthora nicotianae (strain INRA-310) TaxID=761204 RepID=W2P8J8_PHYN3|nr:hypothetical protein PPTG_20367 [Phytophthora nicotianae INRA-310]ETM97322.1 hypothetical protein PPTG_20367 [Phytophthora nicotianae INRA-310]